jgi:putative endonuclease
LMSWYTYVLQNPVGKKYVGHTGRAPAVRLAEHNAGLNRWTKANGPWALVYFEEFDTKSAAMTRERYFKTGTGQSREGRADRSSVRIESAAGGEAEVEGSSPPERATPLFLSFGSI